MFANLQDLMVEADVDQLEHLCDWFSSDYQLDAWVITDDGDPDWFEVGFGSRSLAIDFPIAIPEFWAALDDLHEEVEAAMEAERVSSG